MSLSVVVSIGPVVVCLDIFIYIYIYKRSFDFVNCVSRLYLQLWSLQIDKEMIRGRFIQLLLRFD